MIDNGNRPVLVVSNNPSRAERVAECLRKEGGRTTIETRGVDAAALIAEGGDAAAGLLVLDLSLPELDRQRLREAMGSMRLRPSRSKPSSGDRSPRCCNTPQATAGRPPRCWGWPAPRCSRKSVATSSKLRLMSLFEVRLTAYLLLAVGAQTPLAAQRPWPSAEVRQGTLSFDGKSSLGDFTGTTSEVRGQMTGGAAVSDVRGWVEAPVKTLKTGNDRRDRDLVKTMEAELYPNIRFELGGVTVEWERGTAPALCWTGTS